MKAIPVLEMEDNSYRALKPTTHGASDIFKGIHVVGS